MTEIQVFMLMCVWLIMQLMITGMMKFLQPDAGVLWALGPRDREVPTPVLAARAERATRNLFETFAIYVGLTACLLATQTATTTSQTGALIYLICRVVYFFMYVGGISYIRTVVWMTSLIGLFMMAKSIFM